jgi:hypothetical protein
MTLTATRRSFLGGLLTLAVLPSLHAETNDLTPLEIAVEDVRRAYLRRLQGGPSEIKPLVQAIQRHRALGLSGRERILTLRLALRLARRDCLILRPLPPGIEPKPFMDATLRAMVDQKLHRMMEQPA